VVKLRNLPEAFLLKMKELLGEEYHIYLNSYEESAHQGLMVNTLKIGVEDFVFRAPFELTPVLWADGGFYYGSQDRPGLHPYYDAGLYYIQEPSAMAPAVLLGVTPGHKVLDLCAAPGGKAFQLAAQLKGEGFLLANEIHPLRVRALGENLERMGVQNAVITQETPERLAMVFENYFNRILVDAPCSGEGMFRKNPEVSKIWSSSLPIRCSTRQKNILEYAAKMLAPGGRMVYSTCTFSPEENEGVVNWFLEKHQDFSLIQDSFVSYFESGNPEWVDGSAELIKTFRIWPHKIKGEGHFMALLEKDDHGKRGSLPLFYKRWGIRRELPEYNQFIREYICEPVEEYLYMRKDHLYRVPPSMPDISGLRVLRTGFHLGTLRKNRFVPSHALALALKKEQVLQSIHLASDSDEVIQYLQGHTLPGLDGKGWALMTVDGFSLGWGRLSGGMIKNYYPKGLRRILTKSTNGW
jgi:NOL1/NOP2/sun family putative RNA methylase